MTEKITVFNAMKLAIPFWKKYFIKIIIIGLIVYIPTQICIELVSILIAEVEFLERQQNGIYNFIRDMIGSIALLGIINFVVKILEKNEEQTIMETIIHGLKKWPKYIGMLIIAGFKILGYTILLIIPGIYKFVKLSFIDCVVATDNDNNKDELDALDENEKLVHKQWWKIFGFLLLMFTFRLILELILLLFLIPNPMSVIRSFIIGVIIQLLGTYFIVVRAIYFLNIKKIKNEIINEPENCEEANGI